MITQTEQLAINAMSEIYVERINTGKFNRADVTELMCDSKSAIIAYLVNQTFYHYIESPLVLQPSTISFASVGELSTEEEKYLQIEHVTKEKIAKLYAMYYVRHSYTPEATAQRLIDIQDLYTQAKQCINEHSPLDHSRFLSYYRRLRYAIHQTYSRLVNVQ